MPKNDDDRDIAGGTRMQSTDTKLANLYESDFNLWLKATAELLRSGKLQELDIENLIEEIEGLARSDRRELRNRARVLLMHLLKWQFQPDQRSNSWRATIRVQRSEIQSILLDSPSLRAYLSDVLPGVYPESRPLASDETGLALEKFPEICPYSVEQLLDQNFLPRVLST